MNKTLFALALFLALGISALPTAQGQSPGTLRWVYDAGDTISSSPVIGADGTIYLTSERYYVTNFLHAVAPDGTARWILRTNPPFSTVLSSPTIGDDGTIYVSLAGALLAANPDGTWKWINPTNGSTTSPVAIANDGALIVGQGPLLLCLNTDGSRRWQFQTINHDREPPAIARDGTIVFGSYHARIYAFRADGTPLWDQPNYSLFNFSPSLGADGTIYGCSGLDLYSLSPQGTSNWVFKTGGTLFGSSIIGPEGNIYLGANDGIYALRSDGTVLWKCPPTNGAARTLRSCPALARDGTLYFTDNNNSQLTALNTNGSLLWSYPGTFTTYPSPITTHPSPVVGPDGTVYFCSDNKLIALYGSAPLANSPWPMYRRDARHTSRSGGAATRPARLALAAPPPDITLTANCEWGREFRVQSSTDLIQWTTLSNFTGSMQPHQFTWPAASGSPAGFYRIVSP